VLRRRRGCGNGGGELTGAVARRRMEEAVSTGADMVVTACQQCVRTLSTAARTTGSGLRVVDITTFIAKQVV